MTARVITGAVAALALCAAPAAAMSLRVQPVLLEVSAPARAATLTLRNDGDTPLTVQARIYLWTQANGQDELTPTQDVAVSPPIVTLAPRAEYLVRVVRTAPHPAQAEESYRLLVDEIPDPAQARDRTVTFVLRQSIPVFFGAGSAAKAQPTLRVTQRGAQFLLEAANAGERRIRLSAVALRSENGKLLAEQPGLAGYVLARSTMNFSLAARNTRSVLPPEARLSAVTDTGKIDVAASLKPLR